jgi:hypothetical protein
MVNALCSSSSASDVTLRRQEVKPGSRVQHAGSVLRPRSRAMSGSSIELWLLFRGVIIKLVKVTRPGIEPRTFWTYTKCFNQLSYPAIPWRTSFFMIPQTIRGEQPCAQISISDSPCRPYINLVTA